jgi:hypothetical protein
MLLDEIRAREERLQAEAADYQRRLAERAREQERLHMADPHRVPMFIPVDDPEFGTEAWTAGWETEPGS